jgi:DNA-binding transcriptional MerR regulator
MDTGTETFYTIKEAAEETGLTAHTLRYYERVGLLDAVPRESSGHRRYGANDLQAIRMLTCLRRTGMPIRELQQFAALLHGGDPDASRRLDLLRDHRERVVREQEEVARMLDVIDFKIDRYRELGAFRETDATADVALT